MHAHWSLSKVPNQFTEYELGRPSSLAMSVYLLHPDGRAKSLAEMKREIVQLTITRFPNNLSEVCRVLRIGRSTLYRYMKENENEPTRSNPR
jgi:DNA-binding NtrC family response regulator